METVAFCEQNPYCQSVLRRHWPDVPIYPDVRTIPLIGGIDVICGGFPCQPFSQAGKQLGSEDDRHLWPAMLECIQRERPTWVIGENVVGIIGMALDGVCSDLENSGYSVRTFVIPACAVDAPHRRERVWIVAYSERARLERHTRHESIARGGAETPRPAAESGVLDLWPTPTASEHKYRLSGRSQQSKCLEAKARTWLWSQTQTEKNAGLNPEFVEWLMKYPIGWTESGV